MAIAIVGTPVTAFTNSGAASTVNSPAFTAVSGNKIVVMSYAQNALGLGHIISMTDDAGNIYVKITNKFESTPSNSLGEEVWECDNCIGLVGNVVHVIWSASLGFPDIVVYQVSGITGSTALAVTNSGGGTVGNSFPTGPITTTNANSIVIIFGAALDNRFTYPSGYTNGTGDTSSGDCYQIYSSIQTGITPTETGTNVRTWATIAVAYAIASGGGPSIIMPNNGQLYPLQYDLARQFASTTRNNGQLYPP